MNRALIFLLVRSVRGRVIRAIRLLKQPKYFIGIAAFIAWMVLWVGGAFFFGDDPGNIEVEFANIEQLQQVFGAALPGIAIAAALVLAIAVVLWWLIPWSRIALGFTEAEIHMLTLMPVRRRHLIQYATLKSQPGILFGCLMMSIFLAGGGPVSRLRWFLTFWVFLSIWDLHSKGRSLWLARQKELPASRRWRNHGLLVAFLLTYGTTVAAAATGVILQLTKLRPAPDQQALDFIRQSANTIVALIDASRLPWLLEPFVQLMAPFLAAMPGTPFAQQLTAMLFPLAVLVVHNEWVVRSQTKFEEAALAHARREAAKTTTSSRYWKTSLRSRRRMPFPLPAHGPAELGILWKNSMMVTRWPIKMIVGAGLTVIVIAAATPAILRLHPAFLFSMLMIGFMLMAIGPLTGAQSYRNDLRGDLLRIEMLRPWPIEGWKLFAAEAAGPALYATLGALAGAALIIAVSLTMTIADLSVDALSEEELRITPDAAAAALGVPAALLLPLLAISAMPISVALTCLAAALQNLVVLLFPGWIQLGTGKRAQGAAAFGQNMLAFFGLSIAILLSLLPAAIIIGILLLIQVFLLDVPIVAWEFPLFGLIAAVPVLVAAGLVVRAGGRVWDRLDASREVLEGAA